MLPLTLDDAFFSFPLLAVLEPWPFSRKPSFSASSLVGGFFDMAMAVVVDRCSANGSQTRVGVKQQALFRRSELSARGSTWKSGCCWSPANN